MEQRGKISVENVPPSNPAILERLDAYQNTRNASFQDFAYPKGVYIATRFGDSMQTHHVRFPLGARKQMTFLKEPIKGCKSVPPDGPRAGFVYGKDSGGDEQMQLYFFDSITGKQRLLTDGKSKTMAYQIWQDKVVFDSNEREKKFFDLYVSNLPADDAFLVTGELAKRRILEVDATGYWFPASFCGTALLVHHYLSITNSTYYLLELPDDVMDLSKQPVLTRIFPPEGQECAVDSGQLWLDAAGNVTGVLFSSDEGSEFSSLRFWSKETAAVREVVPPSQVNWSVESIAVDPCAGQAVIAYNEDGVSTFYRVANTASDGGPQQPATKLDFGIPDGEVGSMFFRATEPGATTSTLGFGYLPAVSPMETYTVDFGCDGPVGPCVRWTDSEVGGLDTSTFVQPTLVHFKSFDGLEIPAFVYRPRVCEGSGRLPVLLHPHGGPEGQHRPRFSPVIQYLCLELGIVVVDPNVRGSDGYGKTFVTSDNCEKREDSVKDIGALLDWIGQQPDLDASRVGIWGGSYGGYMVLASLVHYSAKLRCGVDMVGISNFVTFLENTSEYRRDQRRLKYGDERDPNMRELLLAISPMTNAAKITRPLFIVQGANDPRVPLSEAEQIRDVVRANGLEVWYMVASDEGHGFSKKTNRDQYQEALVAFLQKHLLPETP